MKFQKILTVFLVLGAVAGLSACKTGGGGYSGGGGGYYGGGGGTGGGGYGGGGSGYQSWYDVYGTYCGSGDPSPGCNFYWDGSKVMDYEDPYYSVSNYLEYGLWDYTDSYGYTSYYDGWAWLSSTGILYDEYGYALNENKSRRGRDLLAKAASQERKAVESAAKSFSSKYALSSDTGVRVAQTLRDWATLSKSRSRTQKDVEAFTKRLYGIDYNKVEKALTEAYVGDRGELDGLIEEGAANWGTSPETMREILRNWYSAEASAGGIEL